MFLPLVDAESLFRDKPEITTKVAPSPIVVFHPYELGQRCLVKSFPDKSLDLDGKVGGGVKLECGRHDGEFRNALVL